MAKSKTSIADLIQWNYYVKYKVLDKSLISTCKKTKSYRIIMELILNNNYIPSDLVWEEFIWDEPKSLCAFFHNIIDIIPKKFLFLLLNSPTIKTKHIPIACNYKIDNRYWLKMTINIPRKKKGLL